MSVCAGSGWAAQYINMMNVTDHEWTGDNRFVDYYMNGGSKWRLIGDNNFSLHLHRSGGSGNLSLVGNGCNVGIAT